MEGKEHWYKIVLKDEEESQRVRYSFDREENTGELLFVDPPGGPYIAKGVTLYDEDTVYKIHSIRFASALKLGEEFTSVEDEDHSVMCLIEQRTRIQAKNIVDYACVCLKEMLDLKSVFVEDAIDIIAYFANSSRILLDHQKITATAIKKAFSCKVPPEVVASWSE